MERKDLQNVGRLGRLDLRFRKRDNRTILHDSFSKIPLKAFQPFYLDETGCAYTCLVNPTGKRNGILEYMPGYVIPFSGSIYRQKTKLCMDEGSAAFILDFFTTGRVAMGEHLQFTEYRNITEIEYCGELILSERIFLKPGNTDYNGHGFLESFPAMAVIYLVFDNPLIENSLISEVRRTIENMSDITGGVSTLSSKGVVVRMLGQGVQSIENAVFEIWPIARKHIINLEYAPPMERINIVRPANIR